MSSLTRIKKDNLSKWCPQYNEYHQEWKNYYLEDVNHLSSGESARKHLQIDKINTSKIKP